MQLNGGENMKVDYDKESLLKMFFHDVDGDEYRVEILRDVKGDIRQLQIIQTERVSNTATLTKNELTILKWLRENGELRNAI